VTIRARTALKALYLLAVAVVLLLPILKIRRVLRDEKRYASLPDYGDLHRFDPDREGGHLLPNLNLLVKTERASEAVRFITNSKGFRSEKEFSYDHTASTFRILFLGDSYSDGMRTDQKLTIGYLLEEELNARAPAGGFDRFEVMISGHNNPTNARYYFQRHGYKYRPDLVLLGVTLGNDLTWNSYRSTFVPVRDAQGRPALEWTHKPDQDDHKGVDLMIPYDAYIQDESADGPLARERRIRAYLAARSILFGYEIPPIVNPLPSAPRHFFATDFSVSLGLFYMPMMPGIDAIYADFEETLAGFADTAARNGSRLAVVLFPVRIQLHGKDWELLRRFYRLRDEKFDLEYPDRRLLAFCRSHDILCTDALPALKAAAREHPWSHLYRARGDMHFNERGQEVVAAGLRDFVSSLVEAKGPIGAARR
jgi:hypothetical protein